MNDIAYQRTPADTASLPVCPGPVFSVTKMAATSDILYNLLLYFNHCVLFEIVKVEFLVCATYFSHIFHYLLQCVKMYDFTTRKSEDETKQMSFWLS